jgi:hypothetical protein
VKPPTRRLHRRRITLAATAVAGAGLLGKSLSAEPDSREFYLLTSAVAALWTGSGLAVRSDHRGPVRRDGAGASLATPVAIGAGTFATFYGAARVARRIPVLDDALYSVMDYSHRGSDALVLGTALINGVAEEVFFRGAVYDVAGPQHRVAATTVAYMAVTSATRNPALVLASGVMGWIFAAQRRATGGIRAPIVTHLTWTTLMLRYLPPLFDRNSSKRRRLPERGLPARALRSET